MTLAQVPAALLFGVLGVCAAIVLICGVRMTALADRIADRSGFGEALVGGVLLGAATSLSGMVVSLTAALEGRASLAFTNGVGGIAVQTAFLAFADLVYRKANLEHAAAELTNLFQGTLLILLLAIPLFAYSGPDVAILGVHPASFVLLGLYGFGVRLGLQVRMRPMWQPVETEHTVTDRPLEPGPGEASAAKQVATFLLLMLVLAAAGYVIAQLAVELIRRFGISATLVGSLLTAVLTSLPELVTTLAAVRRGALQLAVGGIVGGNTYDTLFVAISDIGYRQGSVYHALTNADWFWLSIGIVMTAVLLLGQIYRERQGPGGIGLESVALLAIYLGAVAIQALRG